MKVLFILSAIFFMAIQGIADTLSFSFSLPEYSINDYNYNDSTFSKIKAQNAVPPLQAGVPETPCFKERLLLSENCDIHIIIQTSEYFDTLIPNLLPSKMMRKDSLEIRVKNSIYLKHSFFPTAIITAGQSVNIGNNTSVPLTINPFRYNPVSGVLRIYTRITYSIISSSTLKFPESTGGLENQKIYINTPSVRLKASEINTDVNYNMLIIHPEADTNIMAPFIAWKNQKGIKTKIAFAESFSDKDALKTYITSMYYNEDVRFVLLVGDDDVISPYEITAGTSDQYYGCIEGDDSYPELIVGRFAFNTEAQLQTLVNKTINYEKMQISGSGAYTKCIMAGSEEGPGDEDEYDYEHLIEISTNLLNSTYTETAHFFDGQHGSIDETGDPDATQLLTAFNNNAGAFFYTGHGTHTTLSTSGFDTSYVSSLTNTTLPYGLVVGCNVGEFNDNTCIAERLSYTSGDTCNGFSTLLASSEEQWWDPPMYTQDRFVDQLIDLPDNAIPPFFGALAYNAFLLTNDAYFSYGYETTETWILFGDPTLQLVTDTLDSLIVEHDANIFLGDSSLTVTCNSNNTLICISQKDSIITRQYCNAGSNLLEFSYIADTSDITLTATAFNMQYYQTTLSTQNDSLFLSFNNIEFTDKGDNSNTDLLYKDTILCSFTLSNYSSVDAENISVSLNLPENCNSINKTISLTELKSGNETFLQGKLSFAINELLTSTDDIDIKFIVSTANKTWVYSESITVHTPEIRFINLRDIASDFDNGNLSAEPGEIFTYRIDIENLSLFDINAAQLDIIATDYNRVLSDLPINIDSAATDSATIQIAIPYNKYYGLYDITLRLTYEYFTFDTIIQITVGDVIEDWESNTTTHFAWQIEDNEWTIDTSAYEGVYALQTAETADDDSAVCSINIITVADDSVSFYVATSTEAGYDELYFYIDGEEIDCFSGIYTWQYTSCFLEEGSHTLSWVYSKDDYLSKGDDRVYIDYITLPPFENTIHDDALQFVSYPDSLITAGNSYSSSAWLNKTGECDIILLDTINWLNISSNATGEITFSGTAPENSSDSVYNIWLQVQQGDEYCTECFTFYLQSNFPPDQEENSINIYPTPADELLHISYNKSFTSALIEICNQSGQTVLYQKTKQPYSTINVQSLPAGMYFVTCTIDSYIYRQKILIK